MLILMICVLCPCVPSALPHFSFLEEKLNIFPLFLFLSIFLPQFCFYLLHWAACGFWYVALQEGAEKNSKTWVAQEAEMLSGSSTIEL